jgi:uncharacterized membrane protein YhaH (DUF805 family)
MNNAIKVCFSKYFDGNGRASRSEFWYFYLFVILVNFVVSAVVGTSNQLIGQIIVLAVAIPLIAAGVRRIHDHGKSGWFILVPFYNLYLYCTEGEPGENQYGAPAIKY